LCYCSQYAIALTNSGAKDLALKYLELANPTNPIILRIKERIINSNPRLFGQVYKLRAAPYPTIDVKVLMPLRAQTQHGYKEEKKASPMYKTALSPKTTPAPISSPKKSRSGGMFVPNPHSTAGSPPKNEPISNPTMSQPRVVPPPVTRPNVPTNVFRSTAYHKEPTYDAPVPQPISTPPVTEYPPPMQGARPTPPKFVAPALRPSPRPVDNPRPFPGSYEQRPTSFALLQATNPVPSGGFPTPPTRTFVPPPVAPASASHVKPTGPPKKSILEQANFGITPMQKEVLLLSQFIE
jgi:hypothetical protein